MLPMDGIVFALTDLALDSSMVHEVGPVDEPGPVRRPLSQGQPFGGTLVVSYPCTEKVVGEQVAP